MKKKLLASSGPFFPVAVIALWCLPALLVATAWGQPQPPGLSTGLRTSEINVDYGTQRNLLIKVVTESKAKLDRQAVVKVRDKKRNTAVWDTTSGDTSDVIFKDLDFGDYDVEISAVGYLTENKTVHISATIDVVKVDVTLQKDPEAVDLKINDGGLPPNLRREADRGLTALKGSNYKEAHKRLEKVAAAAPSNAQVNFLLGFLCVQEKNPEKAESYLAQSVQSDPRRPQALVLLGRVQLQREHYEDARKTLERAVAADPSSWMAHNLLGASYLKLKDYEKAKTEANLALSAGNGAATAAYLVLGQALANLGQGKEGIQALNSYMRAKPDDPAVPQVKNFITEVEKNDQTRGNLQMSNDAVLAAAEPTLPPSAWGPPGVDDVKPSLASGAVCPYDRVMEMSGERVKQLVDSISQFSATEALLHEQLDPVGNPTTKETRKFDYVASISESKPGLLQTSEYRDTRYGLDDLPDRIVSSGFVSLALIFHPDMRDNYEITCEGLGDWRGQATWLMHFRQRDDKPSRLADLVVGGEVYPINLKGRAWITADTFQIVRIESELMNRIPVLAVQHQIAEYGPIHFQKANLDLWLPKSVDLFFELNRHRYYRRHSFDNYRLFAVNSEEKPHDLKAPENQLPKNPQNLPPNDPSRSEGPTSH